MITRSFLVVLACSSNWLVIQTLLPETLAVRITPNVDEFMTENQRTRPRTRQNYMVQRALDDEFSANMDYLGPMPDAMDTEMNPDELSSQIVDYANMIRNDIIYLDNSVETTTRKRGNIKKKNVSKQHEYFFIMPDPPCSCVSEREIIYLGDNFFPTRLESQKCSEETCPAPYRCKANYYWIIVLKRVSGQQARAPALAAPADLYPRWEPHRVNVTTACVCSADHIELH